MTLEDLQQDIEMWLDSLEGNLVHGFGISKEGAKKELVALFQSHIREVLEQIKKKHICDANDYCGACEDYTPIEELRKAFGV